MTVAENLARLFPLHYQRIVELTHEHGIPALLKRRSQGKWGDLGGLFPFNATEEGIHYWWQLATGEPL